jgi:hypothetical protein
MLFRARLDYNKPSFFDLLLLLLQLLSKIQTFLSLTNPALLGRLLLISLRNNIKHPLQRQQRLPLLATAIRQSFLQLLNPRRRGGPACRFIPDDDIDLPFNVEIVFLDPQ